MLLRPIAVLTGMAIALLLVACGGDEPPEPTGTPVASISMTETEYELDPAEPRVEETGVIEFELSNEGEVEHNLEVETPQGEFELDENIPAGETATLKTEIEEPGEYVIYCPVSDHRERGMEGTLTVGGGGQADDQGTKTDQDASEENGAGGGY